MDALKLPEVSLAFLVAGILVVPFTFIKRNDTLPDVVPQFPDAATIPPTSGAPVIAKLLTAAGLTFTLEEKVVPLEQVAVIVAGPDGKLDGITTLEVNWPCAFRFTLDRFTDVLLFDNLSVAEPSPFDPPQAPLSWKSPAAFGEEVRLKEVLGDAAKIRVGLLMMSPFGHCAVNTALPDTALLG